MRIAVVALAIAVAGISALPYAGGWNDGSRLAAVESLGDRGTFAIDDSIFVDVRGPTSVSPYRPGDPRLREGTKDKLLIEGRYYSDKPPVASFLLGGIYRAWRLLGGDPAAAHPARFVYLMTVASVGIAYVLAVWSVFELSVVIGLRAPHGLLLAASLGLASVALPYARHVNAHLLGLGVSAVLAWRLARLTRAPSPTAGELALVGSLGGLAYSLDLGAGLVLLACTVTFVGARLRSAPSVAWLALGAAPWVVLHHVLNYAIGGTIRPVNTVPAYLAWPGSPFSAGNMTGVPHHAWSGFVAYAVDLLLGKRGFLGHNPTLLLAVGSGLLLWRHRAVRPELSWAAAVGAGTWLLYAVASNNYAGLCASVRWFVPLLAPGALVLALLLRHDPRYAKDLAALSSGGAALALAMWWNGPWEPLAGAVYWPLLGATLLGWGLAIRSRTRAGSAPPAAPA